MIYTNETKQKDLASPKIKEINALISSPIRRRKRNLKNSENLSTVNKIEKYQRRKRRKRRTLQPNEKIHNQKKEKRGSNYDFRSQAK